MGLIIAGVLGWLMLAAGWAYRNEMLDKEGMILDKSPGAMWRHFGVITILVVLGLALYIPATLVNGVGSASFWILIGTATAISIVGWLLRTRQLQ